MSKKDEMIVTPWKVIGTIDYDKLIEQFGVQPLTEELLERIKKHAGDLHVQLRRRLFFSHRDLDWILDKYENGEKFFLYTGRGPSGPVHLGHLVPWFFTKWLQDVFDVELFFQMTDDEKFLVHPEFSLEVTKNWAIENALDVIAVGFHRGKTHIIYDVDHIKTLYPIAIKVAKHTTISTAKAVFGFDDSSNIGIAFFPSIQAAPCFIASVLYKKNIPCFIPAAIDQDPYWRVTRDIAEKLGYYKPAQIHCKFLPGLGKGGKMSASMPETCIFTIDTPEGAEKKVMGAFTGGRATVAEQRKLGGNPNDCTIFQYMYYIFEEDDKKVDELFNKCKSGAIICGECKSILAEKLKNFLIQHQEKRERAKSVLEDFRFKE